LKILNNFGKEFASDGVEAAYTARTIFFVYSYTGSCTSSRHQRFMREKILKNEVSEKISQKFHEQ